MPLDDYYTAKYELAMKIGEKVMMAGTGRLATVRYIGQIDAQNFIGIEYDAIDDQFQGKYNGTYNGVEYFTCAENHGAFVKERKLLRSLEVLIQEKYAGYHNVDTVMQISDGMLDKNIEFKGVDMVDKYYSQIRCLESISINNCGFVERFDTLAALVPKCKFLDLSGSPVDSSAILVLKHLPELECIDFSGTAVVVSDDLRGKLAQAQRTYKCSVFMNEISSDAVTNMNNLSSLPFISEVLMNNVYFDIFYLRPSYTVEKLYINYCCSGLSFQQLSDFVSYFSNLVSLSMAGCVSDMSDTVESSYTTDKLTTLNLAKCTVSLHVLFQVRHLAPALRNLKLSYLADCSEEVAANITIGLFGDSISTFNAGEVKQKHIRDCEIYLCNFMLRRPEFYLRADDIIYELALKHYIAVKRAYCQLLDEEQLGKLELVGEENQTNGQEGEAVKNKFNGRIIKVKYAGGEYFFASIITPFWHFRDILKEKGINARWIVCDERRELLEDIGKHYELRNVVTDFVCEVL